MPNTAVLGVQRLTFQDHQEWKKHLWQRSHPFYHSIIALLPVEVSSAITTLCYMDGWKLQLHIHIHTQQQKTPV